MQRSITTSRPASRPLAALSWCSTPSCTLLPDPVRLDVIAVQVSLADFFSIAFDRVSEGRLGASVDSGSALPYPQTWSSAHSVRASQAASALRRKTPAPLRNCSPSLTNRNAQRSLVFVSSPTTQVGADLALTADSAQLRRQLLEVGTRPCLSDPSIGLRG